MALNYSIRELRELADLLTKETNVAFDQMSQSFLKRRLNLFGDKKGLRKHEQLLKALEQDAFKDDLLYTINVPVTELFRDAGVWRNIRDRMLQLAAQPTISVWIPHVSSGEELYTLLIIARETGVWDKLNVTAGYCSSALKEQVKNGIIQNKKMEMNLYNYKRYEGKTGLEIYIEEDNGTIKLKNDLLSKVEFKKGLVTDGQPAHKVDLILFRNVMLYFKKSYHAVFKDTIDSCLKPGGWLCVGEKEHLPSPFSERFEWIDTKEKIYTKFNALND